MIEPRTVTVTAEIGQTDMALKGIKSYVRTALVNVGVVRTIQVNVIQGSRKKKAAKKG